MLYKLTLITLAFWWGAFTFLAAVVIPIGANILGSQLEMGFITQQVTNELNFLGMLVFMIYAYYTKHITDSSQYLFYNFTAALLIGGQLFLFLMHYHLTDLMDFVHRKIPHPLTFHSLHRAYMITNVIIWAVVSVLLFKLLQRER
ncbi:hypothetical protein [Flectobacillus major]|jgi:hypothetical protein|uniref:hypothetical protein n=1 Tax=Flectobacillus major TaxID=103 RepID=UPI0004065650|nr:hypothetical protein [Flectobacillus major]